VYAAVPRYINAGSALALASAVAITPLPPRAAELHAVSLPTRLVDAESILSVPLNLFYDLVNVRLTNSTLGTATERLGCRRRDPPKMESLTDMLPPFPELSEPLGQQVAGIAEAEFPTNPSCAAVFCSEAVELMQNWLAVLLSQLTSGYYFDPTAPGSVDAEARRYAQPVAAPD